MVATTAATRALIDAIGRGWDEDPDVRPEISEIATALEGIVGRCDSEMGGGRGPGREEPPGSSRTR